MIARALVALLSLSSIEASEPTEDRSATRPSAIDAIVVDAGSEATDQLREEIRLRLGRRTIAWAQAGMQVPEGSSIWVVVGSAAQGVVKLQFVVSDGRAYSRSVDAAGDDAGRAIASAIANTVAAIEAGHVEPEATGVPLPTPPPAKVAAPEKTAPEPTPAVTQPKATPPAEVEPAAWIGIGLGGIVGFGFGPPTDVQGLVGGGGFGHVRFLHRTGATAALQVRGLALPRDGVLLSRVRIALSGGYAWQPNRFELIAEAGVTVEPIWLAGFELAAPAGDARSPAPLVGGRIAISPGVIVWTHGQGALRLGLELDLAQSVEARTPAGAVQILRRAGEGTRPFMRAGGFELCVALGAELRFGVGKTAI